VQGAPPLTLAIYIDGVAAAGCARPRLPLPDLVAVTGMSLCNACVLVARN
jgi:hypothetical protein